MKKDLVDNMFNLFKKFEMLDPDGNMIETPRDYEHFSRILEEYSGCPDLKEFLEKNSTMNQAQIDYLDNVMHKYIRYINSNIFGWM